MTTELKKTNNNKESNEKEMSFLDHLEELRWHIIRSMAAVVCIAVVVFMFKELTFSIIMAPTTESFATFKLLCSFSEITCVKPNNIELIVRVMGEQFFTHIKVSIWIGIILAFPYIFWEIWRFIKPGLYNSEQKAARGLVFTCSFLFFTGVLFGYFIVSPFAIKFLTGYQVTPTAINSPTLSSYVNYMTMLTIPLGILFELPVLAYFLSKIGLISSQTMKKYRRHAIVIILILSAIITPPDVFSQVLISIPIYILYEASIRIAKNVEKKQ